jgi:hypothetical protein
LNRKIFDKDSFSPRLIIYHCISVCILTFVWHFLQMYTVGSVKGTIFYSLLPTILPILRCKWYI